MVDPSVLEALSVGNLEPAQKLLREFFQKNPQASALPPDLELVAAACLCHQAYASGVDILAIASETEDAP
jgi:hypothetical protein